MSSIIWALRSDNSSFNARYSAAGLAASVLYSNVANIPTYDVDATAIGGHNFNLDQGAANVRALNYPARGVFTNQAFSVLMRLKFPVAGTYGLMEIGPGGNAFLTNYFLFFMVSNFKLTMANETPTTIISNTAIYANPASNSVWTDIVFTWDGSTTAGKMILYIDGVSVGTLTASAAATNPRTSTKTNVISIGGVPGATSCRYLVNEVVMWDYAIDPTSVALTSGTGSLNGASRTAFVDVASYDGTLAGGAAKNRIGRGSF